MKIEPRTDRYFVLGSAVLTSLAAHGLTYSIVPGYAAAPIKSAAVDIDIQVAEPLPFEAVEPPELPETDEAPEARPPEPPQPLQRRVRRRPPAVAEPPPPPPEADEPPEDNEPFRFPDVLSSEAGDKSFQVPTGGIASNQPTSPGGSGSGGRPGGSAEGVPGGVLGGTGSARTPPAVNRSRRTRPPSRALQNLLQRNYPPRAKARGIEGSAVVRVRISGKGSVQHASVVRESVSGEEFGAACRRTLMASGVWEPEQNAWGEPISAVINFTCNFTIKRR
ncbi:MAG: TonB family protein [Myxococcota bacterium]